MLDKKCWHWVRLNMGYNCNNEDYLAAITHRIFMKTTAARDTWHVTWWPRAVWPGGPVWPRGLAGSHHRGSDKCGSWKPNWISDRAPPWCRHPSDAGKIIYKLFSITRPHTRAAPGINGQHLSRGDAADTDGRGEQLCWTFDILEEDLRYQTKENWRPVMEKIEMRGQVKASDVTTRCLGCCWSQLHRVHLPVWRLTRQLSALMTRRGRMMMMMRSIWRSWTMSWRGRSSDRSGVVMCHGRV